MKNFITAQGRSLINLKNFFIHYTYFTVVIIRGLVKFKFFNSAVSIVIFRQIYFTGIQILPMFTVVALALGLVLVGGLSQFLADLGAFDRIGPVLVSITVRELAPIITTILLTLRSSTAVTAEIALMKMNNEISTLESLSINYYDYLFLPRVLAGFICMVSLSTFFVVISIIGGYSILSFKLSISFDFLIHTIFDSLDFSSVACYFFKMFTLGYFIMSIPLYSAMEVKQSVTEIPIALLKGMMRLFYAIIIVEAVSVFI